MLRRNKDFDIQSIKQRFGIIGNSPLLNQAIERAVLVAPTDLSVLILGESGVGKESFAKIIHELSPRRHNTFLAINCGAIPEGTIDSELFGHEKGAFTGATEARKGFFEVADKGTLFLDEIGEMPLGTQARLLRVLEYGEFIRVGSSKVQKTDVRIIAATNVNLEQAVREGKFREDLYYRLSTMTIYVPPLRERGNDIFLLFQKFAIDFAERYRVPPIELTEDAMELLRAYRFPGNIRQLRNLVYQISLTTPQRKINAEILSRFLPKEERSMVPMPLHTSQNNGAQDLNEREILYKVLFDMRRDITELKKLVFQLIELSGSQAGERIIEEHKELFQDIDTQELRREMRLIGTRSSSKEAESTPPTIELPDSDSVIEIEAEESLSLEDKEKEMIIKALKKHNHRRRAAAEELGISERTLYRKIKKYGLENL
ncbi:MAG: sigma-54-dependent Fis family transcriptional regulator [Thermonema sp.]|uniref:sigma-54 interaction domain-containing protein n=1 Tax=Thermonema sp. TaxID=2231181 RepID=UPI0021DE7826|nr:sigma-54 dependent transcriptional regulator [Thermonema sp.]GIV39561.1 MAG: sigma-54-dependent Fis family transcriptional regulator [Thermonema sp.]